ncbi:hypothetical protein BDM02DRAFT_3086886 [Thelephora ganbajun]|uniref:Uncharacterized protein n=1 Tax=Thelephora ganbajun TaxID=370292 RepID=A0ACB6ZUG2_THEGA|nr:hypothetical protein BDM02DRAFT_3086886 [Thelephora ganbajun]
MTKTVQETTKDRNNSSTDEELYAWTMRREAIASCLVEDIFHLRPNSAKNYDFNWLGCVPCRSVKIAGMVIGIKDYESKRIYTIDDNTGIIECHHKNLVTPLSPSKRKDRTFQGFDYPPLPPPATYIGRSVIIAGRICRGRKIYLTVESIVSCKSYNEELAHWNTALVLRESHYFTNTPFVIPEVIEPPQASPEEPTSVHLRKSTPRLSIPPPIRNVSKRRTPDCQEQIPSKSTPPKSPVKLRHPSKVHKRDLTANTLKIYLKHYMDNQAHANDDYMTLEPSATILDIPAKRRRTSADALMPRPTFENRATPIFPPEPIQKPRMRRKVDPEAGIRGLTMSYLRRVPELRLLAERIVAAEDKKKRQEARRAREEAKSQGLPIPSKTENPKSSTSTRERTKRLFRQAIIKLYGEGSIIVWDGPCRVWGTERDFNSSRLWHTNTTVSSVGVSVTGGNSHLDSQDHEMSEPDPKEEGYVSLTPAYLGKYVEKAIEEICSRKEKARGSGHWGSKGPTLTEILSRLKTDGRWRSVGECIVADALQWLKDEERVWEVGGGHWELTI